MVNMDLIPGMTDLSGFAVSNVTFCCDRGRILNAPLCVRHCPPLPLIVSHCLSLFHVVGHFVRADISEKLKNDYNLY